MAFKTRNHTEEQVTNNNNQENKIITEGTWRRMKTYERKTKWWKEENSYKILPHLKSGSEMMVHTLCRKVFECFCCFFFVCTI